MKKEIIERFKNSLISHILGKHQVSKDTGYMRETEGRSAETG